MLKLLIKLLVLKKKLKLKRISSLNLFDILSFLKKYQLILNFSLFLEKFM